MTRTWREGFKTVLAALVVAIVLATTQGWDWPLLGTHRATVVALFAIGFVMCQVAIRGSVTSGRDLVRGPFMLAGTVLGIATLVVSLVGVFVPATGVVVALGLLLLALWAIATLHHLVESRRPRPVAVWRPTSAGRGSANAPRTVLACS